MSTALKEQHELQERTEGKEQAVQAYLNDKVVGNFTKKEIDVLRSTIAAGTNNEEFALFVQTCVNSGLNPFLNHIHPIVFEGKYGRKLNIQISVEGILSLARKREGFAGVDVQLVHENDAFKMARIEGSMQIVQHEIGFPRGQVVGGYAVARRHGFPDVITIMEADEVQHMKSGRNSTMWTTYFNDMFKKHLVKRAAKEQYGIELTEDDVVSGAAKGEFKTPDPARNVIQVSEQETIDESKLLQTLWVQVEEMSSEKGLEPADVASIIAERFNNKSRESFTASEIAALLKFIEFYQPKLIEPAAEVVEAEIVEMDLFTIEEEKEEEKDEMQEFETLFS